MTAFETAWALLKMPFVPGSVREGELEEGDENWEDRQNYLADFYDPNDDKTRQMNIRPTWKRKPKPDAERRVPFASLFGGGGGPEGTVIDMPLDEDELRDPELLFGQEQQIPFSYFYRNNHLDRLFTPKNMRRRGIGTGMVDAMQEYRERILGIPSGDEADAGGWGQITGDSDDNQTEDMFRFWHKRGYMPSHLYPKNANQTIGEDTYYGTGYRGSLKPRTPRWDRQGPNTEPFDVGFERAFRFGQNELGSEEERNQLQRQCDEKSEEIAKKFAHLLPEYDRDGDVYEMGYELHNRGIIGDDDLHADGNYTCSCWAGHPWYETEGENMELHEAKKHLFPYTWANRSLYDEDGMWVGE